MTEAQAKALRRFNRELKAREERHPRIRRKEVIVEYPSPEERDEDLRSRLRILIDEWPSCSEELHDLTPVNKRRHFVIGDSRR